MPRVKVNNRKYKEQDLNKFIKSRCIMAGIKVQDVAKELGIDRATLYRHLKQADVPYGELLEIIEILKLPDGDVLNLMRLNERTR